MNLINIIGIVMNFHKYVNQDVYKRQVLKPFPVPITVLLGVATSSILLSNTKDVLAGYSNTALWLIFAAFALSVAFGKTGLGHRIAYHLVRLFGSTTLRLGYVTAFLDLILSPATPSNTARAAGIVYPINLSIAEAVGSYPVSYTHLEETSIAKKDITNIFSSGSHSFCNY